MSKNNQTRTRRRLPRWAQILLTILASCLVMSVIGMVYIGNRQWKMRNDENLIKLAETAYIKSQKLESGLEIHVDDDGVIKLRGNVEEEVVKTIATVTLPAGTYTLGGFVCDADSDVILRAKISEVYHYAGSDDKTFGATFTLTDSTIVTVELVVKKDTNLLITKTMRPTIAEGKEEIDFYE